MMKSVTVLALCIALNGCTAIPAAAIYSGALKGVERVGGLYMAETRSNVDKTEGVACLTGAMTRVQIVKLGSNDSRFLTPAYRVALEEVANRPEAANCLAALGETAA
jgi:hypothetical protein